MKAEPAGGRRFFYSIKSMECMEKNSCSNINHSCSNFYYMTKNNILNALFGSRIRAKLLGWFFTHTDEQYFVRQVAPIIQEDPTNVSREMARLESFGILVSARQGNLKQFKANKNCSFFNELKGLVLKTVGISGQMEAAIREIPGIELAFIYGSFAKGLERADSDVDLFVVGDVDLNIIDTVLQDTEKAFGRTINYVVYDLKEFKEKLAARDGFIIDVINGEKIVLKGDAGEFKAS